MNWFDKFKVFFRVGNHKKSKKEESQAEFATQKFSSVPIKTGRASVPSLGSRRALLSLNHVLTPEVEPALYELLKDLSIHNRHIKKAMDDLVGMANTDFQITLPTTLG